MLTLSANELAIDGTGSHSMAASGAQRLLLESEILLAAGNAGISVERHGSGPSR